MNEFSFLAELSLQGQDLRQERLLMNPLFTNTARKKKQKTSELCSTVTLSITGDTSHRGPPNLPETAAGRPHKVFVPV